MKNTGPINSSHLPTAIDALELPDEEWKIRGYTPGFLNRMGFDVDKLEAEWKQEIKEWKQEVKDQKKKQKRKEATTL